MEVRRAFHIRVAALRGRLWCWDPGSRAADATVRVASSARSEALYLADGHAAFGDAASKAEASLGSSTASKRAGVAGGEATLFEKFLDGAFEFEEADGIGDGGAVFAGALGNLFLGQMEFINQALEGVGLFDRVEIFALKIFYQRHFEGEIFGHVAQDDWHGVHAGALGSAPTAFAGD